MIAMFEDLNTRSILEQVPAKLQGEATRSLWRRLDSEFSSGAVSAVESYLVSQFSEIRANVRSAVAALKNSTRVPSK
jgi:hypothetical protein